MQENDYFCIQKQYILRRDSIYIHLLGFFLLCLMIGCGQKKQEPVVTPWGEITDTIPTNDDFDLEDIQRNGELIALTLTGPETYYDYRGRHLGAQYLLAQRFADKLGVSLRMEVCRDTAEMRQRLVDGDLAHVVLLAQLAYRGKLRIRRVRPVLNCQAQVIDDDLILEHVLAPLGNRHVNCKPSTCF